jgi:predicted Kef-type K+ transport protein
MTRQYYADVLQDPQPAAYPTITAIAETVLVPTLHTSIAAFEPRAGKVYKLTVGGTCTTGTAGTLIITPRFGTLIGGVALGPSATQNYVPSVTLAPFVFEYWLVFRSIGQAGANSTCIGFGKWVSGGAIATAASATVVTCGSTGSVSVDTTAASALWIGVTFSVAPSVIPHFAMWQSLN